jgi:hypothetical protein
MKGIKFLILFVLAAFSAFGQAGYTFKVIANKGTNQVKSGDSWVQLKAGASLQKTDILQVGENAYLGLVSAKGKPMELKKAGNYTVSDLETQAGTGSTVLNKYTDFILSSNAEGKKNRLSATGAVHRATETTTIKVMLPDNQKYSDLYNTSVFVSWDGSKAPGPYVVVLKNFMEDQLDKYETETTSITIDLSDPKYAAEAAILLEVSAKNDAKQVSKQHLLRRMSPASKEAVAKSLTDLMGEVSEPTAINKFILAGFYEENNLLIDAIASFEEAVKLEPSYKEYYDEFLMRHGLKK